MSKETPALDILNSVEEEILMLCRFGSHLYGTDTPESDTDYKGIFMPTKEQILLGKIPKSINNNKKKAEGQKNTKDDVDFELYSLHYFIELACKGETVALDMLHCNEDNLILNSEVWERIVEDRSMFYTKNLKSFVGYARKQAAKYGLKGSRLNIAKEFIKVLSNEKDHDKKLGTIWDKLPISEHSKFIGTNVNNIRQYQICGKILQETVTLKYAQEIVLLYYQKFGERAKKAARNEGIDWKAVSHAIRAAYQVREIFKDRTITFPLKQADFIRKVKQGELDFTTQVLPKLESLIGGLELYVERSTLDLPEEAPVETWERFIQNAVLKVVTSKKFAIDIKEIEAAHSFAKKHGNSEDKVVTIETHECLVGTGFTVSNGKQSKDITNTDNW